MVGLRQRTRPWTSVPPLELPAESRRDLGLLQPDRGLGWWRPPSISRPAREKASHD